MKSCISLRKVRKAPSNPKTNIFLCVEFRMIRWLRINNECIKDDHSSLQGLVFLLELLVVLQQVVVLLHQFLIQNLRLFSLLVQVHGFLLLQLSLRELILQILPLPL